MYVPRAISFVLVTTALLTTMVRAQPQAPNGRGACFFSRDFQQWKAPDPNTILIRVGVNRFYRLDLTSPCRTLQFPDAHLITVFHGSDSVCSPLDWDLRVSQYPAGITEQCVVRSMTQLTPEQVASIPPRLRP